MKNKKLQILQVEYNKLFEQLGYMKNKENIKAVNTRLDEISAKMKIIIDIKNK